ncbi:hypothetical protein OQA87_06875 [Yersinia intermedia]|nr:hypothetical protein [Yersinia intermedia]EEQ17730.1 hypothetical protein yinte0001_19100 [Yersinia intermedia ATCC 29909]MCW8111315.1 hypothetical protein [Yersinia intermedia]
MKGYEWASIEAKRPLLKSAIAPVICCLDHLAVRFSQKSDNQAST